MTQKLRVLWASDAPWAKSGYGVQTKLIAPHLAKHCDLALLCTYGLQGDSIEYQGVKVYPGGADPFANDVITARATDWRADVVMTLKDVVVFRPDAFKGVRWCPLIPVDHEPAPPHVLANARAAYAPIAYAPNGVRELRKAGMMPLYAPHVYDASLLYRIDRTEARRMLGVPEDAFLALTVAVNRGGFPSRKAWAELVRGFVGFAETHPNALWFAHTYAGHDGWEGSLPLQGLLGEYAQRVAFPHPEHYKAGFDDAYMRTIYSAADVLLAPSLGEGFGVPVLEAQACGVPVIVGDWAATADLCFGGVKIAKQDAFEYFSVQMANQYMPYPHAITAALSTVAAWSPDEWQRQSNAALQGAAAFEVNEVIADYWVPLLASLQQRIANERYSRGVQRIVNLNEVIA